MDLFERRTGSALEVLCMCMDRQKGDLTFNYYDMNFNLLPFEWVHPNIKTGGSGLKTSMK